LVTRTLERAWEEKLRELERIEREYQTHPRPKLLTLTEPERQRILDLAKDLPALWNAETTTNPERKPLLRLLIKDVTLKRKPRSIDITTRWQTEAVTRLAIERPRRVCETRKTDPQFARQIRRLAKTHTDRQIVQILHPKGLRSAMGRSFTMSIVKKIPTCAGRNLAPAGSGPMLCAE